MALITSDCSFARSCLPLRQPLTTRLRLLHCLSTASSRPLHCLFTASHSPKRALRVDTGDSLPSFPSRRDAASEPFPSQEAAVEGFALDRTAKAGSMLALTFTQAAALNLMHRVDASVPIDSWTGVRPVRPPGP